MYSVLKQCCCVSVSIRESSASSQTTTKRLKQTPGETPALRKEVRLVYFPNLYRFPQWGLCFWRCTSLWSLFLNPQGHNLLPRPPCPDLADPVSRDRINCWPAAVAPPTPSLSSHTNHTPPAPPTSPTPIPALHSGHSNVLCKYDKWQHGLNPLFPLCLIAYWPMLLPTASYSPYIKW